MSASSNISTRELVPAHGPALPPERTESDAVSTVANHALVPLESQPQLEAKRIHCANLFSSSDDKEQVIAMAALAKLMYSDDIDGDLPEVSALFPRTLTAMPTPESLRINLPRGLRVRAFRHGEEVIIAIRGTELNKETGTMLSNLIADAGIGRHKSNDDLLRSIPQVNERVKAQEGVTMVSDEQMQLIESLFNTRVQGDTEGERSLNIASRVAGRFVKASGKGGAIGGAAGIAMGSLLLAVSAASLPVTATLVAATAAVGALGSGTVASGQEVVSCLTAADGYPQTLAYIGAIDSYISALKGEGRDIAYIKPGDSVITVGHSLAGYLAAVTGAMHADDIYAFNGPGVMFGHELNAIIHNLGRDRKLQPHVGYRSISMEKDFIGNLTSREGSLQKLYVPSDCKGGYDCMPDLHYGSPLAHHGIATILEVLKKSGVFTIPMQPSQQPLLLLTAPPAVEEVSDDSASA